ncbi:polysaccharide biosynthesis/export family protein [Yoonia sp. BS5-3]|uniref:Polysaccharide biosynthesis/export family protein n=1 Tax=Yoonia phaeophyticola TaxID=3137369 RepID=A0ABZ2V4A2_9RHOB
MVGLLRRFLQSFAGHVVAVALSAAPLAASPLIAVGDELQVDFLDDDADPYVLEVGDDGAVQLPYVGAVAVAGSDIDAARQLIAETYVTREIFLSPQLELSFVAMRPLSVLGDVQEPGFYDFRAFVTVEQAVGLAGGIVRNGQSEEGRAMQRATLFGELARIEGEMMREAVATARLNTQLADGQAIDRSAVALGALDAPDMRLVDTLVDQDNAIIAAELAYFQSENDLLVRAVSDARMQIDLTEEQIAAQEVQITSYDEELDNNADLVERGLVPAPVRAQLLRQVADEKTDLLRLRTNVAAARLQLISLERQQLELDYQRRQTWRLALADAAVRTAQLRGARDAVLDRIDVLDNWSVRTNAEDAQMISYLIRRRGTGGAVQTVSALATDALSPGDVLIVRLEQAETPLAQVHP